jgi:sugar transferase (PEP-CTERM/EpsH1 system associated)
MQILMLSPVFPWPLDMGSKIRVYHSLKELSRRHEITFVSLTERDADRSAPENIKPYCKRLHIVYGIKSREAAVFRSLLSTRPYRVVKFWNKDFHRTMKYLLRTDEFDILWVHFLNMTAYIDPSLIKRTVTVLDQHNADEFFWRRYVLQGSPAQRVFARQNLWKLRHFEKRALLPVDVVLSTSEEEAAMMKTLVRPACPVWAVPNGVDIDYFKAPSGAVNKKHIILFCGAMDVNMNIDAATRFAEEYYPAIKKDIPDAEFWIVGRNPAAPVRELASKEGIYVTGLVEDVRPYYEKALVAVAPFRFGGGTKIKVLEAMAMGVPVVSTSVGCQGIRVASGTHLVIEDSIPQFVRRVVEVMKNREEKERLISNAAKLVREEYSWQFIYSTAEQRISRLLQAKSRTSL